MNPPAIWIPPAATGSCSCCRFCTKPGIPSSWSPTTRACSTFQPTSFICWTAELSRKPNTRPHRRLIMKPPRKARTIMKAKLLSITLLVTLVFGLLTAQPVKAQTPTETPTGTLTVIPTATPTTPVPSATSTTAPSSSFRPVIILDSYGVTGDSVTPGQRFDLTLRVFNTGQDFGRNLILTYSGGDLLPLDTGGVRSIGEIDPGEKINVVQPFIASSSLAGASYASLTVNVSYTDLSGSTTYSESFAITLGLNKPSTSGGGVARPTATPTAVSRPQLVVSNYETH